MGASVRIEDEAFSDERYEDLAHLAGLADADHARGKMARLWRQCTLEQRRTLPASTVTRILGSNGVNALVEARLGDLTDDGVRIRGTKGRIEWLKKLRENGKYGSRGGRPKKNPQGFSQEPTRVSENPTDETPLTPALTLTPVPSPAPIPAPTGLAEMAAKPKRTKREASDTPLPSDWEPKQGHRDLAASLRLDCSQIADDFRDKSLAKGYRYVDWDAAFRTWLKNARKFADRDARDVQTGLDAVLAIANGEAR